MIRGACLSFADTSSSCTQRRRTPYEARTEHRNRQPKLSTAYWAVRRGWGSEQRRRSPRKRDSRGCRGTPRASNTPNRSASPPIARPRFLWPASTALASSSGFPRGEGTSLPLWDPVAWRRIAGFRFLRRRLRFSWRRKGGAALCRWFRRNWLCRREKKAETAPSPVPSCSSSSLTFEWLSWLSISIERIAICSKRFWSFERTKFPERWERERPKIRWGKFRNVFHI